MVSLVLASLLFANGVLGSHVERQVPMYIDRTELGITTVNLMVGTPPRPVVFMLDFQSDVSGLWEEDLLRGSMSFCDECRPLTRDYVYFGPYFFMIEMRSVVNEIEMAVAAGSTPPWAPPYPYKPLSSVLGLSPPKINGWLALGPRSEIWNVWNSIKLNRDLIVWEHWSDRTKNYLTDEHRTYPNINMALHPELMWWHEGWLVIPHYDKSQLKQMPRDLFSADVASLTRYGMRNATFVMFGNDSRTLLAQRYYNRLFYGANLYHSASLPREVKLAPGLTLQRTEWLHEAMFTHLRWMEIDYIQREAAASKLAEHPIAGITADDLNILGMGILNRFQLRLNTLTRELSLVVQNGNDHLNVAQLWLLFLLALVFLFLFLARSVYMRPLTFTSDALERKYSRQGSWLTVGFHMAGHWWIIGAQFTSIVLQVIAYGTSDKLADMRRAGGKAALIFWMFTVFVMFCLLLEVANFALILFSPMFMQKPTRRERFLARIFVISQTLHTFSLLACGWIVLMQRSTNEITTLSAALFSIAMMFASVVQAAVLGDWVFYEAKNVEAQLFPTVRTAKSFRYTSDTLTYDYALLVLLLALAWTGWLAFFTAYLQLYEQLQISLNTVSKLSQVMVSVLITLYMIEYGIMVATSVARVNHMREEAQDKSQ